MYIYFQAKLANNRHDGGNTCKSLTASYPKEETARNDDDDLPSAIGIIWMRMFVRLENKQIYLFRWNSKSK